MVQYIYRKNDFKTFTDGIRREWVVTNGIGGYAGSSLIGAHNRTHQGYLIASLHAPTERYLVLSKVNESFTQKDNLFSLETSQHKENGKTVYAEGQNFLEEVIYDGAMHWNYQVGDLSVTKHFCLEREKNCCAIAYDITNNGDEAVFTLTPLFNFREHSDSSTPETLQFDCKQKASSYTLIPKKRDELAIHFQVSDGNFIPREKCYDVDMQLQIEVDLETPGLDSHYCPTDVSIVVPAHSKKKVSVLCSILPVADLKDEKTISDLAAFDILASHKKYIQDLITNASFDDAFANQLVLASDHFLTQRKSTGLKTVLAGLPWFTDWGRDTMIAFTGLTLCTKRFKEAEEILLTFAKYVKNGIVPNMFPDDNTPPLYNTVDASLWYFYAVYEYLQFNPTKAAYSFIEKDIYPRLIEIINAYKNGTDFSIYMEEDGLIHAGSGLDQITWMDVRVGDWVATPRHGKPVEINALWYNALKVMEMLSEKFGKDAAPYSTLAALVKESFCKKFWNPDANCLYDVVDGDEDDHLRPNQIYAVSLPFTMLDSEQEAAIVAYVEKELFVGCGLRSLSSDHKDYHGIYCGALEKRDRAYHQGTAWGFLLGGFFTAYMKVHNYTTESAYKAVEMLAPIRSHLTDNGCIGSVSEIFDGDAPHNPRGCYAQAWSIGEILRCYVQDIMPYL